MNAKFNLVNGEQFVRKIQEVKRESGRTTEEMLKYVMILMLQAGRSATPLGRKNRSLETEDGTAVDVEHSADDGSGLASGPAKQFFSVYKQGRHNPLRVYVPRVPRATAKNAAARKEAIDARAGILKKFKKIAYRGIARASWGWAMRMISTSRSMVQQDEAIANAVRRNPISVDRSLAGPRAYIEVTNKLGYIRTIASDIEARMISSATSRLDTWLNRRWQTGIDRAERRTA